MKKRFSLIALIAVFALVVAACSSDSEETTTTVAETDTSVLDLAVEAGQFSTLIAAIDAAGLTETLQGEGPFTVLAPTDAAFEAAFEALGITAEELLADTDTLTEILLYHVLGQEADSSVVATLDGQEVPTLQGESILVTVDGGTISINEAQVVSPDLAADNGIVHVINGVLLPPTVAEALGVASAPEETTTTTVPEETTTTTEAPMDPTIAEIVVELASADPAEFTILLAAVQAADPAVLDALSDPNQELTVFAPTDAAFEAALETLGITAEDLLASEDLTNILLYHVAPGVFLAADVVAAAPIDALPTLLEGGTLLVQVVDGSVVINESATVIQADVVASNGVIHVIDAVLLPAA
jgi:transforming growth factor-beta-induced protein